MQYTGETVFTSLDLEWIVGPDLYRRPLMVDGFAVSCGSNDPVIITVFDEDWCLQMVCGVRFPFDGQGNPLLTDGDRTIVDPLRFQPDPDHRLRPGEVESDSLFAGGAGLLIDTTWFVVGARDQTHHHQGPDEAQ